jgi:DNA polymerase-3 subunit epsilon
LLDSEILAEVYLELIGGRQPDFGLATETKKSEALSDGGKWRASPRMAPLADRITVEETAAHAGFVERLGDDSVWKKFS